MVWTTEEAALGAVRLPRRGQRGVAECGGRGLEAVGRMGSGDAGGAGMLSKRGCVAAAPARVAVKGWGGPPLVLKPPLTEES